ncbi:cytochrome c oxidase assembly protein [Actinoplanes teichomyceticus]|uniref:Putative membrane protein n=1 Tax=Actinoplanes teichomyceticus TaxID=1867 RepID=A0A561VC60_ACTTI|nr:cytochrome c oxidase assembly protein [Actinoplanes teichomyceticus]TWG09204.1 putative membrane protein [Actinoplanes teichomyceticus]GIF16989.1 membrane protein [Actinoplanes teichomyceticus]
MNHSHQPDGGLILLGVVVAVVGYDYLTTRTRHWPWWRTILFLTGGTLLVVGLTLRSADDFRTHMLQHLLIGMLAPLGLVLGAPVTLLLRTMPRQAGRAVGRVLRSRFVHVVAQPAVALTLNLGGLLLLYLTPLYTWTTRHPATHLLVHLHFLLAGYLFAWVIAGPDPAPRRPRVPARLVVLGLAVAFHATFSQLMYAGAFVHLPVPEEQRRGAATLMYYGGDIAELLLAAALVTNWRPRRSAPVARSALASAP